MNKIFKGLIRFLIEVIVMTVLIVGINIFTNGMYLWGLPRINDIQSVNITYPSVTDDVKEISSSEDIELALKLTGFLKYDLFGEVNSEEEKPGNSPRFFWHFELIVCIYLDFRIKIICYGSVAF